MQSVKKENILQYPHSVDDVDFHPTLNTLVAKYGSCNDILHTVFYGPACSGKLTLARKFISVHTNTDAHHTRRVCCHKVKDREFPFFKSSVHFEMDVNDFPCAQQCYLIDLMQELAKTLNVSRNSYKIIMLHNAEKLTLTVQHQLRRMMELFYNTCRLIFLTVSIDCLDPTIRSRLVAIRVPLPHTSTVSIATSQTQTQTEKVHTPENRQVHEWLTELLRQNDTLAILELVVQQLWKAVNKSVLSAAAFRKWARLISFTHLPIYDVIYELYNKVCVKVKNQTELQHKLIFLINYYMQLYETGTRQEFHIEMILCCIYMTIHNQEEFHTLHKMVEKDKI